MEKYITMSVDTDMTVYADDLFLLFPETKSKVDDPTLSGYDVGEVEDMIGYDLFCIIEKAKDSAFWEGVFKKRESSTKTARLKSDLRIELTKADDRVAVKVELVDKTGANIFSLPSRLVDFGDIITLHDVSVGLTF